MRLLTIVGCGLVGVAACGPTPPVPQTAPVPPPPEGALRTPASFASIEAPDARAAALFVEASRVMLHPRCTNCHPAGDASRIGDDARPHLPEVVRGPDDEGVVGLRCDGCHQEQNLELARVPGAPHWHLAPREMAWEGLDPAALCAQIKDPARNGDKTVAQIVEHAGHDALVAWGWDPGADRAPAPGSQAEYAALMQAWAEAGAACPEPPKETP